MPDPLDPQINDVALLFPAPESPTAIRVPTAEEASLNSQVITNAIVRSRLTQGWRQLPTLSISQGRRLTIAGGRAVLPTYPGILDLATAITIPALVSSNSTTRQTDWIYLVAFLAEVGAAQDPILGQFTFQYRNRTSNQIDTITKENARRLRAFWSLVLSPNQLTPATLLELMTPVENKRSLTIADTSELGFALGSTQFYARDAGLKQNTAYLVFPDSVQLIEMCQVRRLQRYTERGYTWGHSGEEDLQAPFHLVSTAPRIDDRDLENAMRLRLRQIFSGKPGVGAGYNRAVQNLAASAVGGNPGFPGEAAGSPNGSVCLANDQRISFTNQGIIQKLSAQVVTATNNGSGSALVACTLNTNSPSGSFFSGNRLDHRVYSSDGIEQSGLGTFSNLGGTGSLIWVASANSTIAPGQIAYICPGIYYPPGSGFSIPFEQVERAWRNAAEISPANIRPADHADLDAYEDPVNNEDRIIVTGRERAAIHYILKRISITTNGDGTAIIPNNERGCFAFIQGVAERIDAPAYRGLTPNTTYKALIYSPPLGSTTWQFLLRYAEYQGTGAQEPEWLNGATIASKPLCFIHTQGGGSAVHQGEADTRLSPIAMHLPAASDPSVPAYRFNAPVQVAGEPYAGPLTLREYALLPAPGLALPAPGQSIALQNATLAQPQSLSTKLLVDGQTLGFRSPALASRSEYQIVVVFVAERAGERRLVVMTRNTIGAENLAADSDLKTAIDTFRL